MELSAIKSKVRSILDYNEVTNAIDGLNGLATNNVDKIIENSIESAAKIAILMSPRSFVKWETTTARGGYVGNAYVVDIPEDFLRLGVVKLDHWKGVVSSVITAQDEGYYKLFSEYQGIRPTDSRPQAVHIEAEGHNQLYLYPSNKDSILTYFSYAKAPKIASNAIEISTGLVDVTMYVCAALVAETLKDTDKSNNMMQVARNLTTSADSVEQNKNVTN